MNGGQIVPGIAVIWLLLCAAAEGLERPSEVLLLQRAEAQGEPPLWVQRIYPQGQLPVLCCLHMTMHRLGNCVLQKLAILLLQHAAAQSSTCQGAADVDRAAVPCCLHLVQDCEITTPTREARTEANGQKVLTCTGEQARSTRDAPPRISSRAARCAPLIAGRGCCAGRTSAMQSRSARPSASGLPARTTAGGHLASPAPKYLKHFNSVHIHRKSSNIHTSMVLEILSRLQSVLSSHN